MGVPGPGTIGQMVPGTRDHHTWDQDHWLNFLWDQGPKPQDIWDQGPLDNHAKKIIDILKNDQGSIRLMYHNDQNNDNDECSVCPSLLGPGCYHLPIIQSGIQWYFREYIQRKQAFFAPTQCRQRPKIRMEFYLFGAN